MLVNQTYFKLSLYAHCTPFVALATTAGVTPETSPTVSGAVKNVSTNASTDDAGSPAWRANAAVYLDPPTVRMESDIAAAVVISASGQTIMATVAAGTRTPPTPNDASDPKATVNLSLSGLQTAKLPAKVVMNSTATSKISLLRPGKMDKAALKTTAPTAVVKAGPIPRTPILTGMGS
ncbi:unnamed protein product [Periconia digitata]|uniref:Uncharacterized protein n=1 Tax=Periconia digitata TaxID=1303443 RepID=A0A9W4XG83_9PLEO|nr:unnamed protein product [Periconia digitata]